MMMFDWEKNRCLKKREYGMEQKKIDLEKG